MVINAIKKKGIETIAATIRGPTTKEIVEAKNAITILDNEFNRLSRIYTSIWQQIDLRAISKKITRCLERPKPISLNNR